MMAWRSPVAFWPPSIGVSAPKGYGPLSLSAAYRKLTATNGCVGDDDGERDPVRGPTGRPRTRSPDGGSSSTATSSASHAAQCGSTGRLVIGVFQTLSAGNIGQFGAPGTVVLSARCAAGHEEAPAPGVASNAAREERATGGQGCKTVLRERAHRAILARDRSVVKVFAAIRSARSARITADQSGYFHLRGTGRCGTRAARRDRSQSLRRDTPPRGRASPCRT